MEYALQSEHTSGTSRSIALEIKEKAAIRKYIWNLNEEIGTQAETWCREKQQNEPWSSTSIQRPNHYKNLSVIKNPLSQLTICPHHKKLKWSGVIAIELVIQKINVKKNYNKNHNFSQDQSNTWPLQVRMIQERSGNEERMTQTQESEINPAEIEFQVYQEDFIPHQLRYTE